MPLPVNPPDERFAQTPFGAADLQRSMSASSACRLYALGGICPPAIDLFSAESSASQHPYFYSPSGAPATALPRSLPKRDAEIYWSAKSLLIVSHPISPCLVRGCLRTAILLFGQGRAGFYASRKIHFKKSPSPQAFATSA